LITKAGPAMARMDAAQHRALRDLGVINRRFAQSRVDLIERCEADINRHYVSQSFVFGAILLILLGAFLFGRRLSAADRALEEERGRVKEMRRERLAAIGELCSSVAHGIRNPLAAIRSSAQLALELGQLDRGSQERIQDILDEGQRLGDRVTGLLSMARATSDSFAPVDLNSVVDVSAKSLLPEIERLGLALDLELSDEPVTAEGDRARLEQCIVELLSNAMEHSPADGTILVRCYRDKKNVVVEVEDEGPGVSAPVRERVFDLFFTTKPAGTGIGLATVRRIARLHGGDATLDEVSAGGARFVVRLPRASVRSNEKSAGFRAA
jgi:signal transduction histidine kinase